MEEKNCKGRLLHFCPTKPEFINEHTGPPHDYRFICKVFVDNQLRGEAEGKQQREAENKASKLALEALGYTEAGCQPDFVPLLYELCQKKCWTHNFLDGDCTGPPHNREFTCSVKVNEKIYPESSKKKSKKLAKKEAAYIALVELKKEFPNDIQALPEAFKDESRSENCSHSGSQSDVSQDRSIGENGLAQLKAGDSGLDRSPAGNADADQSELATTEIHQHYVVAVHEFCQKKKWICTYLNTNLGGPQHNPQFSCKAEIDGRIFSESKPWSTKKDAKKEAGFIAWRALRKAFPGEIADIPNSLAATSLGASSSSSRKSVVESGLERLSLADSEAPTKPSSSSLTNGLSSENPLKYFEDITKLNAGSYGKVFKARKIMDDRYYAVKQIPLRSNAKRQEEEVKALAQLEHPNIVRYFNAWWEDCEIPVSDSSENSSSSSDRMPGKTCLFIQMELCENGSLHKWMEDRNSATKPVNKKESMTIFKQIIEAVKYIHSLGLIHRDLKPANILFTKAMVVKIGDFGLVTQMTKEDESRARLRTHKTGTPSYMAPEQMCKEYENEVDIYALGLILVELLWKFGTVHERALQWKEIRKGDLFLEFKKTYPLEVCEIRKMLSEDPQKRPSAENLHKLFYEYENFNARTQ